jgi:hypothetical protein
MTDRLDSLHLNSVRREDFRRARESLFQAVGEQTRGAEEMKRALPAHPSTLTSMAGKFDPQALARLRGVEYVLMDRDAVYPLKTGVNTVGRLSDNDVVIPDPFLSRRHCAILVHTNENCELHDVASKNGTFLNGKKLAGPTALSSGDEIRMCDRQLLFVRKADLESADSVADQTQID